jgi:hypothetical protein
VAKASQLKMGQLLWRWWVRCRRVWLVASPLALAACGTGPTYSLAGQWQGSGASTDSFTFQQTGHALSGTSSAYAIDGSVNGSQVSFTMSLTVQFFQSGTPTYEGFAGQFIDAADGARTADGRRQCRDADVDEAAIILTRSID